MNFLSYQIWNSLLTAFLIGSAFIFLYISLLGFKHKNHYGGVSTFLSSLFLFYFGIYNIIFGLFPWPYNAYFAFWIVPLLIVFLGFYFFIKFREKREERKGRDESDESDENDGKNKRDEEDEKEKKKSISQDISINIDNIDMKENYTMDTKNDDNKKEISLKMELLRKSFHLAGLLLIVCIYGIGFGSVAGLINNAIVSYISSPLGKGAYETLWGSITEYPYNLNDSIAIEGLTFFALWASFAFMCIPEYIRILAGGRYSAYNYLTKSVLREKEHKSVGPQVYLVLGVIVSFYMARMGLYPFEVSIAASLIACFSDALAAVIGRTFGRHKVKVMNNNTKSIEGFITGAVSAFIISVFFIGPIYALIGALIFLSLDYLTPPVADNLINPVMLSLGIMFSINSLQLPVMFLL
ncbi:MAG: hypothetical protein ACTSWY_00240 [Promethearchaeota archaeon]